MAGVHRTYYVSVQSQTIMEHKGDAAYEFEIRAMPEDIEELTAIFGRMADFDQGSFLKAHAYAYPYHSDPENDGYDYCLRDAYRLLFKLGTVETKQHIEKAGLLQLEQNNG